MITIKQCKEVQFGTSSCAYEIYLPYQLSNGSRKCVSIDKCLLPEILKLWEKGIRTTGNCCGHGKMKPFIGVENKYIDDMINLGYKVYFNKCRPNDKDMFIPKTEIKTDSEVEPIGEIIDAHEKCAARGIKIIKEVTKDEIRKILKGE